MSAVDFAVDVARLLAAHLTTADEQITPTKYLTLQVPLGGSV
jgi:hypothetical protein